MRAVNETFAELAHMRNVDNRSQRDSFPAMGAAVCRRATIRSGIRSGIGSRIPTRIVAKRAKLPVMAGLGLAALVATGCLPDKDKEPKWQKPPKAFDVKGADLTFNEAKLEAFNSMDEDQRTAHLAELQSKEGSFKGQAVFKRATELGEKMDDLEYGKFEVYAIAPGPDENQEEGVWLEVNIEYHLFSEQKFGEGWPPGSFIEFTGTYADMTFQDQSKPRKMELKVKATDIHLLKD